MYEEELKKQKKEFNDRKNVLKEDKDFSGNDKFITPFYGEEVSSEESVEMGTKKNRTPTELPDRLPTRNMKPLMPDEHKMIGMYESKQTLYLLIAHSYNKVMERLDKLENRLDKLDKL